MINWDYVMLYAVILCGVVLFGNVLLNPGANHKTTAVRDSTGAFVIKTVNWGMFK